MNASGAVKERYEYDPYGNCTFLAPNFTVRAASSHDWETTYAGYRWDQETGLYQVRNRFYSARLGTWLQQDPVGYLDSFNFYEYCKSQPTVFNDPNGLWGWGDVGSFIGSAVAGVAVGIAAVAAIVIAAPVVVAAGAAALTFVGVSAATAATLSGAAVTGTLLVAGTVGIATRAVDTVLAIRQGNYNRAAYNAGTLAGGYSAARSGLGHRLVPAMGGKPSMAPRTLNPIRLCRYEYGNRWQLNHPDGLSPFSPKYWATAPTPVGGSLTAAGTSALPQAPKVFDDLIKDLANR